MNNRRLPIATIGIVLVTAVMAGLQLTNLAILDALRRDPVALAAGAWWRLLSPLLVDSDGWVPVMIKLVGVALVGVALEPLVGSAGLLGLYLTGGLAGNVAGYAWDPHGAGASVGLCGLLGGLAVWLLRRDEQVGIGAPIYALYFVAVQLGLALAGMRGAVGLCVVLAVPFPLLVRRGRVALRRYAAGVVVLGGVGLTLLGNNHGPPILAGAALAALVLAWSERTRQRHPHLTTTDV